MAILKVAQLGHPVLRRVADPVPPAEITGPEIQRLIADMLETVEDQDGAGLAAPQVHVSKRVVVLSLTDDEGFRVWINPEITPLTDELVESWEGCLSVTGMRACVARVARIRVKAYDQTGRAVHLELAGFPAIVAQHECDHLDGVLYVDRCDTRTLSFLPEYRKYGPYSTSSGDAESEAAEAEEGEA